jgi:1,4-dihydroxy-2-naphthoate octaprenyltransferase
MLATHHHLDHVGGIATLLDQHRGAWVAGHARDQGRIPRQTVFIDAPLHRFIDTELNLGDVVVQAMYIPGHTLGAIAWYLPPREGETEGDVFTGDTLFAAGCGRLFEGSPTQMHGSLRRCAPCPGRPACGSGTSTRRPTCGSPRTSSRTTPTCRSAIAGLADLHDADDRGARAGHQPVRPRRRPGGAGRAARGQGRVSRVNELTAWLQAARPLAQVNILVPLLFGQAMAFAVTGRFHLGWLWLCAWLGLLVQLLIVFANDYADRETDARNATFARFSGGSRVLPEGRLTARALRGAALVVLGALGAVSGGLAVFAGRPWLPVLAAAAALLVWAYNFAPLRLAYRGHGEVVQGLGTGVVLPLLGYYVQAGELRGVRGAGRWRRWCCSVRSATSSRRCRTIRRTWRAASARIRCRRGQWLARRHALELLAISAACSGLVLPVTRVGAACWRCRCSRSRRWRCRCSAAPTPRTAAECHQEVEAGLVELALQARPSMWWPWPANST